MTSIEPIANQENISSQTLKKTVYHFYDLDKNQVFKTREVFPNENKIIVYPYSVRRTTGQITQGKIKKIIFKGFNGFENIPKDFKSSTNKFGIKSNRLKVLFRSIYTKYKELENITIGINIQTRFSKKTISFNWGDLETILKAIYKIDVRNKSHLKLLANNQLSNISKKYIKKSKKLTSGELEEFLGRFDDFEKISKKDTEAIAKLFETLPKAKILTTDHVISAKEKIDTIYIEDIITTFNKHLKASKDNEEEWQLFFTKYSWMFSHLFPYQVLLKKDKAFLGGKTFENKDGRIVDFLIENDLTKNLALIEIKTHKKDLLKKIAYRSPDVFSVSDELSGGVNQCLDQKDVFLKGTGESLISWDPKTILIIGQKKNMSEEQTKCFELFRANQKNVDIVTFDELLSKLEGLHKAITGKFK